MSSTAKNTIVVVVVILIIIALFFVFKDRSGNGTLMGNNATSSVSGSNTGSNSGSNTGTGNTNPTTPIGMSDATLNAMLDSAAIRVPNTAVDVALTQGAADYTSGTVKGHVVRGKILGKVPTDTGYDLFTNMIITTANSSSTLNYVALFKVSGGTVTYTSAVVVGDRLVVQGVTGNEDPSTPMTNPQQYFNSNTTYILNISYLDRKNGEAITVAPTVAKVLQARVKNHLVTR